MMNVRVKVDEDLPRQMADLFTECGYDATTVVGQRWQGLSDAELWPRVQQEGRWLVTADKGFANLRTYRELIEPALQQASWSWDRRIVIGPGQVNIAGGSMYDDSQQLIADYLLRFWQMPLAVLEAKAENNAAADVQGRVCP
jgi:hypothetical protein